ncbi:LysR family transcriptional regulator [Kitasatospora sp. NPDC057015]|uniref:LysR family transcriptional regulator n=1 Tax=Kitasatospora sp. NPDC057015 TaxID=3346001 RepID=UPI00363BA2CA
MLDVRRLRLLRELAHRGTIAAVAEALAFSPSAVSQQLSVLEREAGVPLLERTGRRVALTPAGRNLVRHTEAVLARLELAGAELADARQGLAGPLRIGTFPSAARAIIPGALIALARDHPGLEPMVAEMDPARVADALRAGELDVALVHDYDFVPSPEEPGLSTDPLFSEAMYLASPAGEDPAGADAAVEAAGAAGAGGAGTRIAATASRTVLAGPDPIGRWRRSPWIMGTPGTLCRTMAERACEAAGFTPRVRHQVDEFATVLALVAARQGVALVPRLGAPEELAGVTLTRLAMCRRTRTAFRSGAAAHPAVAAFSAALRTALPPGLDTGRPAPDTAP